MSNWLTEWETAATPAQPEHDAAGDEGSPAAETVELDTAEHIAPTSTPAPRIRQKKQKDASTRVWKMPDRRSVRLAVFLVGTAVVVLVTVLALTGNHSSPRRADHPDIAIPAQNTLSGVAPSSTPDSPVSRCVESNSPTRLVTSSPGDTHTAPGVIAAFEHAYFTTRDPKAAAALVGPGMGVTEAGVRRVIDTSFPPGNTPVPYCATITPWSQPDTWAVSADWVDPRTSKVTNWSAVYVVQPVNGQMRIVAARE